MPGRRVIWRIEVDVTPIVKLQGISTGRERTHAVDLSIRLIGSAIDEIADIDAIVVQVHIGVRAIALRRARVEVGR